MLNVEREGRKERGGSPVVQRYRSKVQAVYKRLRDFCSLVKYIHIKN